MTQDPFSTKAAESFLEGSATAAKWPTVGYVVEGTITEFSMAQQMHYDENEPLFWEGKKMVIESKAIDKSRPVMQMIMPIQGKPTGETWEGLQNVRKALPDDDGMRTLYVKAALQSALKDALRKAGAKLEIGAYVRIERIADGPQTNPKFQAPHRYAATWTPAAKNPNAVTDFMADDADKDPFADKAPF